MPGAWWGQQCLLLLLQCAFVPCGADSLKNVCIMKFFVSFDSCVITEAVILQNIEPLYNLESNMQPSYSFRGLENHMLIRFVVKSWILEKWLNRFTCHKNSTVVYSCLESLLTKPEDCNISIMKLSFLWSSAFLL
jgi:hypothetical protein